MPNVALMELLLEINAHLRSAFAWIGNTKLLGISLDIPAHLLIGAILGYWLTTKQWSARRVYLFILALELLKEAYDFPAILKNQEYLEPVKDVLITLLGVWIGRYLSQPVQENPANKPS